MLILGIETSCDETAAAVVKKNNNAIRVLSNIVSSQAKLHSKWGGVVPNLAAREHAKNIIPVINESFRKAKITPNKIDLIAVTDGPGLIPALLIGVNAAKTLSYLLQKPVIGIHHIEGHIYANFIGKSLNFEKNVFPILCLVVSGGHTQLIYMKKQLDYRIIGETLDDAAGEAFDKVARILKIGYPGGPRVALQAAKTKSKRRLKYNIVLPRPMINSRDFNFSFSGLKTAVLYKTKEEPCFLKNKGYISELCNEFQQAVCDVLIAKTISAAKKFQPRTIMLSGGVSANTELRRQLNKAIKKDFKKVSFKMPELQYCVDNASMIATAGYFQFKKTTYQKRRNLDKNWKKLVANANKKII